MNFPFFIAKRYLFSKKSHNAINVISAISVCGVALATLAMVCTLSVFNGFQDMVATFFTAFDPQIKITSVKGKFFDGSVPVFATIKSMPEIAVYSESVEDNAMVQYKGRQVMAVIKGVEDNFDKLTPIDSILFGRGELILHDEVADYAIPGLQLLSTLGTGIRFLDPLEVASYILTSIQFARRLFQYTNEVTAINLRLVSGADENTVIRKLEELLGSGYRIQNRYEQQADTFRIMEIEKLISYVFLTFILMIACFNVIGSLSMLIIDKKNDVQTLRNLGASDNQIVRIFLFEGRMISFIGAVSGVVLGLVLCLIQQEYGVISLGSSGSFVVDAYPVSVHFWDVVLVFVTVLVVGFVSVWYPVRYLSRRLL